MSAVETIERSVRQAVLDQVPATEPGATVNTIACRADIPHHHTRQMLRRLVAAGVVERHFCGRRILYYRTTQETDTMKKTELYSLICRMLPWPDDNGMTAKEIAAHLYVRPNRASGALKKMVADGQATRTGSGKKGDPYRYLGCPDPDGADKAGAEELPAGYSDVLQVAADIIAPLTDDEVEEVGAMLATGIRGRTAYTIVAHDLRARAAEAGHDATILEAAAVLAERILSELEP